MKTPKDIAKMCDTGWLLVYRAIQRMNIVPVHTSGRKSYYDEYQVELIIDNLFYTGKMTHIILESKMNVPEVEESFADFKKRTYGRK